jgi:hypothetical protein
MLVEDLRHHASTMRLLIRRGAEISGRSSVHTDQLATDDLASSMRLAMDAEELPALVDRLTAAIDQTRPPRLDLALRLRDLLEVRRPTRKVRIAPVDGIVVLQACDGFTRLSLQVPYSDEPVLPAVLSLDDELAVAHGQQVASGAVLARGELHLPDLLQASGEKAVLDAFRIHLEEIVRALGEPYPQELPAALAFVRNWMLGWVRIEEPGDVPLGPGALLPAAELAAHVDALEPGMVRPLVHRQLLGLGRLAERFLGGLSPEV